MKDGLRIALAVGAGYLMGRRRKMRLALTLAAAGASGRLGKNPAALVKRGTKLLNTSPEVKNLTETVRGRLVEAGKAAAVTAASSQIDALSDRLQRRTDALLRPRTPGGAREEEEEVYEGEGEDYEEEREERPRRGPAAVRRRPHGAGEGAEDELADRPRTVRRGAPRGAESEDELDEDLDRPRREARPSGHGPPPVRRTGR
ncbi:MAG: hypothetical protein ACJ72W_28930 [Actinoallomurus sp.]